MAGDQILVTNGVYQSGGRSFGGAGTSRVAVTKPLAIRSVNGPESTVIQGYQVPVTTNGTTAIRCVYLVNGASLSGFTLTNGATAMWQFAGGVWCESAYSVVSNCLIIANSSYDDGGGAYQGTLNNCTLRGNSVIWRDGYGGGAALSNLNNCTLSGNSAALGGGAYSAILNNCTLTGNSAVDGGGGAYGGTLNNCTLTGNSAGSSGGGALSCDLRNCIVYFNTASPQGMNYASGSMLYCCTTPQPPSGVGNISTEPQLASASHLSAASPCRGKGSAVYRTGTDIDGEVWANPPAIGCDEYRVGQVTGSLRVAIGDPIYDHYAGVFAGLDCVG